MTGPIPSPGDNLAEQANQIHKDLVQHLLETYSAGDGVAVMLAAAMACRTFLDARLEMSRAGKLNPSDVYRDCHVCLNIVDPLESPPAPEAPPVVMN